MKSILRTLLLSLTVIGVNSDIVFASHVSGGDISYQCLGNNEYMITLNLFRDCSGIDMSTVETITITSSCGTQTLSANLMNPGGTEISQLCPAQTPNSTCNNGSLPGMQRYTYETTATITPCFDWVFSWTTCCRNTTVNVPSSSADGSYIEATLNSIVDSCNNSPVFTSQPIPYVCANQQVIYNWGITEVDGDSLTYQLFNGRIDAMTPLTYIAPYSASNPINGITINQFTGQITFTPTTLGNFIVAVLVNEYDSAGNLIGTTMRDIQFVVQTCSNNPPPATQGQIDSLTGTANQTGVYSLELCDGGNFSFNITVNDPDSADIVTLTSNVTSVLPGATFTPVPGNPATATISWTAPAGATFFNYFTIFANDGACPVPGIQGFVYQVSVNPGTVAGPDTTVLCGAQVVQLGAVNGNVFIWSVVSGDPMVEGVNFSCDTCPNPIADPAITTIYAVISDLTSSTCVNKDTVEVRVVPDFTFTKAQSDSAICLQEEVQFLVTPDSTSTSYSYHWTPTPIFDSISIFDPTAIFNNPGVKTVYFSVTSLEGCAKKDSMQVLVSTGLKPDVMVIADTSICVGDSTFLTAGILNAIPQSCGLSTTTCGGTPNSITIGTGTSFLGNTTYPAPYGNWYYGARHQIMFKASELQAMGFSGGQITSLGFDVQAVSGNNIYPDFTIKMGCTNLTSLTTFEQGLVTVFGPQNVTIASGWNTHTFSSGFDWDGNSNIIVEVCFFNPGGYTYNSPTYYTATSYPSVVWVNQDGNPSICTIGTSSAYTPNNTYRPNVKFTTCGGAPPSTYVYTWFPAFGLSDSSIVSPWANPPSDTSYTVIVTDTIGGCADTAQVNLHVVPTFSYTKTQSDSIICKGDLVQFVVTPDNATPPYTVSWIPAVGVTLDGDTIFNPLGTFDSSGTKVIYFTVSNYGGCNKTDSMVVFVGPASRPIVSVLADTTICAGDSTILNAIISNSGPSSNYSYSWTPGTWLSDPDSSSPWAAPPSDTNLYTVIVKDTVGDCSDTVSINLYVIPGFTFTKTQSDDSICMMENVQFVLTPDSSGNPYSYVWTPGTFLDDASIANPIGTFNASGNKVLHFDITNAGGCTKSDSMVVFVAPVVKPLVTVSGDTAICIGESTILDAVITNSVPLSCGLSASGCSGASTQVTVGTGTDFLTTTSYPAPYGNFYMGAKHQLLFTKAELNALGFMGGQIASLALEIQSISGTTVYNNFEIKMGCTSTTDLSTWETGLVTVFPAQTINIAAGWNTHTFANNFDWDGNSNIIVDICFNNQPTPYTNNSPVYYTLTSFNSVIYYNADGDPNVCSSPAYISISTFRPNVRFSTCGSSSPSSYVYSWTPGISLNDDSIASPTATPTTDTPYIVIVTDSTGNCADTSGITVHVGPAFTYSLLQSDTAICLGEKVQFNVIPSAGTFTYVWTPSANLSSSTISNPLAGPMNVAGPYSFNVSISSAQGCNLDSTVSFVVSPGDIPDLTITGDTSICEGENTQLTATSTGGNAPTYSFNWDNVSTLDNSTVSNPLATPPSTTTYTLIVTDTIGHCGDTATFTIGVVPYPVVQITPLADSICISDNVIVLSATPTSGTWSGPPGTTTMNGYFSPISAGTGSHNVTYTATVNGCDGFDTLKLNVYPNPPVPTAYTDNPYCAFTNIDSVKATSAGGNIIWFTDSLLTDTFFNGNPMYDLSAGANSFDVWVKETSLVGCESNGASKLTILVIPNAVASFSANPAQGPVPLTVLFSNTSQPDTNDFVWNFAGLGSSTDVNPSFLFSSPGTYEVILYSIDANGCNDTTSVTIVVDDETKLIIPNIITPNGDGKNDVFKVQYKALTEYHIVVFNRWGTKVYKSDDPSQAWDGKDLQGQECHAGVYFYVITAKDRNGNALTQDDIKGTITLVRD